VALQRKEGNFYLAGGILLSESGRITLTKMEIILKNSFALSNVVVRFLEISSCLTCK